MQQVTIDELETRIDELDYNKASWIHKHVVIDLEDKAQLLLKSLIVFKGEDLEEAIKTSKEFLNDTVDFVERLNNGKV